jgi:hypothetical protein
VDLVVRPPVAKVVVVVAVLGALDYAAQAAPLIVVPVALAPAAWLVIPSAAMLALVVVVVALVKVILTMAVNASDLARAAAVAAGAYATLAVPLAAIMAVMADVVIHVIQGARMAV